MSSMRHLLIYPIIIALAASALACDRSSAAPPAPSHEPEASVPIAHAPRDAATMHGSEVKFSEPTTLLEDATMRLDEVRWEFGGKRGSMWRVRLERPSDATVLTADNLTRVDDIAPSSARPSAIINGGFYHEWVWGYEPSGLVISGGRQSSELTPEGGSGVFLEDGGGLDIVHRDDFEQDDGVDDALQSVDRLIAHSSSLVRKRRDPQRASRSAIALTDDAVWLVVLAGDGSTRRHGHTVQLADTGRYGVPLWAFATLLVENIGPDKALNLDGAVSTQMLVHLDGQTFSVRGDRGVLNALQITPHPAKR